ncbi:MAG TPA: hypothetical protein VIG52_02260 [Methyloceanibacter sp.]
MTDRDYQACSRSHRAAGTFREGGTFGMVNVESIGGHLLVQHYLAKEAAANRVLMYSTNTRVYVLHVLPATIEVIWTLETKPKDSRSTEFGCTVEARMPAPLGFVASLGLLPLFLRWHVEEETIKFAADIARKVRGESQPNHELTLSDGRTATKAVDPNIGTATTAKEGVA